MRSSPWLLLVPSTGWLNNGNDPIFSTTFKRFSPSKYFVGCSKALLPPRCLLRAISCTLRAEDVFLSSSSSLTWRKSSLLQSSSTSPSSSSSSSQSDGISLLHTLAVISLCEPLDDVMLSNVLNLLLGLIQLYFRAKHIIELRMQWFQTYLATARISVYSQLRLIAVRVVDIIVSSSAPCQETRSPIAPDMYSIGSGFSHFTHALESLQSTPQDVSELYISVCSST